MQPWKCPDCGTWVRGDVQEHRCGDASAGSPARLDPQPPVITPGLAVYGMTWCEVCCCWYFPNAMVPHQHPYPIWVVPYPNPLVTTTMGTVVNGGPQPKEWAGYGISGTTYHVTG